MSPKGMKICSWERRRKNLLFFLIKHSYRYSIFQSIYSVNILEERNHLRLKSRKMFLKGMIMKRQTLF